MTLNYDCDAAIDFVVSRTRIKRDLVRHILRRQEKYQILLDILPHDWHLDDQGCVEEFDVVAERKRFSHLLSSPRNVVWTFEAEYVRRTSNVGAAIVADILTGETAYLIVRGITDPPALVAHRGCLDAWLRDVEEDRNDN
jgi:hypothetical protein